MPDMNTKIKVAVDDFIKTISGLALEAVNEAVTSALGGALGNGRRRGRTATRAGGPTAISKRGAARGFGSKRPPEEMETIKGAILTFLQANPGSRIEQIKSGIGYETKELSLPMKKLIAAKAVRAEGQKRATTYYPSGGKRRKRAAA